MGETPQTAMTNKAPVVLNNDDFYTIVKVGEVHLLVLHPHHADRDHLVDLLPPPLHILPVQVQLFRSTVNWQFYDIAFNSLLGRSSLTTAQSSTSSC